MPMKAGIMYVGGTLSFALTSSCSSSMGILMEQPRPSAAVARKMFSITHQMVASGLNFDRNSTFTLAPLNTGMITYGASLSIVYCSGTAWPYILWARVIGYGLYPFKYLSASNFSANLFA